MFKKNSRQSSTKQWMARVVRDYHKHLLNLRYSTVLIQDTQKDYQLCWRTFSFDKRLLQVKILWIEQNKRGVRLLIKSETEAVDKVLSLWDFIRKDIMRFQSNSVPLWDKADVDHFWHDNRLILTAHSLGTRNLLWTKLIKLCLNKKFV